LVSYSNKPAFSITSLEGGVQIGERFPSYTMHLLLSKVTRSQGRDIYIILLNRTKEYGCWMV
jgi:hypothetical protein